MNWLKNSIDPSLTVEKYWAETSKKRMKDLPKDQDLLNSKYLENYPALRDPITGITLVRIKEHFNLKKNSIESIIISFIFPQICLDFGTLYPEKDHALYEQYSKFKNEIFKYCTEKKKRIEKNWKSLIQVIKAKKNCDNTEAQDPPSKYRYEFF